MSSGTEAASDCLFPLTSKPITEELDAVTMLRSIPLRCWDHGTWRDGCRGATALSVACSDAVAALLPPDTVSCSVSAGASLTCTLLLS